MPIFPEPSEQNWYLIEHVNLLCHSFRHYLGRSLIDSTLDDIEVAKTIYNAPFIVVSHDTSSDPIFNYGNKAAQTLFEMTWEELTTLPSRKSAELPDREERTRLLATVAAQGFIENYAGVRISKQGKRFRIEQAIVWNLIDRHNHYAGQAATFSHWIDL